MVPPVVAALCVLATVAAVASGAPKSPFRPGLYVGRTSQGNPVRLRVSVGAGACEGKPCLYQPNDQDEIYIAEPCSVEGDSTNSYLALFDEAIPHSGVLHIHQEAFSEIVATIKIGHSGTLTGKVRATGTLEDGARCDSGNVTFAAKIGGSTR